MCIQTVSGSAFLSSLFSLFIHTAIVIPVIVLWEITKKRKDAILCIWTHCINWKVCSLRLWPSSKSTDPASYRNIMYSVKSIFHPFAGLWHQRPYNQTAEVEYCLTLSPHYVKLSFWALTAATRIVESFFPLKSCSAQSSYKHVVVNVYHCR